MLNIIDSGITGLLSVALDAAAMRQKALAHNIANVNTPGFRRMSVGFEERFGALVDGGAPATATGATLRPYFQLAPAQAGAGGDIDTEVAALSENTLQHQVLLKVLNRHMAIMSIAVNEGKR